MRTTSAFRIGTAASLALAAASLAAQPPGDNGHDHGKQDNSRQENSGHAAKTPDTHGKDQSSHQQVPSHAGPTSHAAPAKPASDHQAQMHGQSHGQQRQQSDNKMSGDHAGHDAGDAPAKPQGHAADHAPAQHHPSATHQEAGQDHAPTHEPRKILHPVAATRPQRTDIKRVSYTGTRGHKIVVPTNDRVHVMTRHRDIDWAAMTRRDSYKGCPPGLAKKYNGCTPPGLAQSPAQSWTQPDWYWHNYDRNQRYRYVDGYMLQLGSGTQVVSYVPLLGGALAVGQPWPSAYQSVPIPSYYDSYYNLGPANDYRYYGRTLYRVDPTTSAIRSIAALLTGNSIEVGKPMPAGYDVYNVPFAYRDQYVDGPKAQYRYSDGYIYQLDPTTRLVQAAIELLS